MKLYHIIFILSIISIKSEFTKLIFEENFSGNSLNTSLWEFDIGNGDGWGNEELEYYRKNSENIFIQNDQLHIVARVKDFGGFKYTSAKITTKKTFHFTYGKVEARIKSPIGKGIWPAFWMLGANIDETPWPKCGEIDILEAINTENIIYNTLHYYSTEENKHKENQQKTNIENINEFHIYTLTWTKNEIKMLIDDKETYSANLNEFDTDAFQKPFYLLLNLAVGGNWPGTEIDETVFPLEMVIDYIRIYQEEVNYEYTPKILIWEDHFDSKTLNTSIWKYTTGNGDNGWGTEQLQYYTNSTNNVYLSNSNLNLKAIKENYENCDYTSGRISTEGSVEFTYGVIETRMKFPLVDGLSGRLMLYGLFKNGQWPFCGEIDALVGKDSFNQITSGTYWDDGEPFYMSNTLDAYNISQFNNYTIIWDKTSITIYIEEIELYKLYITEDKYEALHNPFYIVLYLLVGGNTVDKDVNNNSFPVEMSVDFISVYQYELNNKVGGKTNNYVETPTDNNSGNNTNNPTDNSTGNNNNNNKISVEENENSFNIKLKSFLLILLFSFLL
jgi:beta-glucanase (GH16 family)